MSSSSFNLNPRAWDWEDFSMDDANDDIAQAKNEAADRQANLEAKAKTAVQEEENVRKRAEVLAALSTVGFQSSGTNTARSFLTSL